MTYADGSTITSATHVAHLNPFRYRGYMYDEETGFYYLRSRYYDPEVGRFLNADALVSTDTGLMGYNMFAYCNNNPVNLYDDSGALPKWMEDIGKGAKKLWDKTVETGKKVVKATLESFHCEVGIGYGVGISGQVGPAKSSVTAYQDGLTVGISNGYTFTAIHGSAQVSTQFAPQYSIGISTEYEHRFETGTTKETDEHSTISSPLEVYNCPNTTKDPLQFSFLTIIPKNGEISDNGFIGLSADLHVGIGGHFAIGWNTKEFWRILTE